MAIDTLIAALETQLQLFEELITLLNRETRELSDIHLEAMAEINIQKEKLAARIETYTAVLWKEIRETSSREGLSSKTALGELADTLRQTGNKEVSRLHKELNRVADRIRQTTVVNREIAERFAASVSSSLELLSRVINQSSTYGASGGYRPRTTAAVMINREG